MTPENPECYSEIANLGYNCLKLSAPRACKFSHF